VSVVALTAPSAVAAAPHSAALTQAGVISAFESRTGTRLIADRRASYPRHYTALSVPQSISNIGRYGRFTVWVVTSGRDEDVDALLANPHTGQLGTPGPAAIYWEHGSTIDGSAYWLAKKRYGPNLVLWWYGSARKTDASFRRLHRALFAIAGAPR
jgi:hypothetical protein